VEQDEQLLQPPPNNARILLFATYILFLYQGNATYAEKGTKRRPMLLFVCTVKADYSGCTT